MLIGHVQHRAVSTNTAHWLAQGKCRVSDMSEPSEGLIKGMRQCAVFYQSKDHINIKSKRNFCWSWPVLWETPVHLQWAVWHGSAGQTRHMPPDSQLLEPGGAKNREENYTWVTKNQRKMAKGNFATLGKCSITNMKKTTADTNNRLPTMQIFFMKWLTWLTCKVANLHTKSCSKYLTGWTKWKY